MKNWIEQTVMVSVRILRATDNMYFLVPEAQAQVFDVLKKTTYKDSTICKKAIDVMTANKTVIELKQKDWRKHMGQMFFFDSESDEDSNLIEQTKSRIETAVNAAALTRMKRRKEMKAAAEAAEAMRRAEAERESTQQENRADNTQPVVPIKQERIDEVKQEEGAGTQPADNEVKREVEEVKREEGAGNTRPAVPIKQERIEEVKQEVEEEVENKLIDPNDNNVDNGPNDLSPYYIGFNNKIARQKLDVMTELERRFGNVRTLQPYETAVVVDDGVGYGKLLMFVCGLWVIQAIYLSQQPARLQTSFDTDIVQRLKTAMWGNNIAYIEDTVNMGYWMYDMYDREARIKKQLEVEVGDYPIRDVVDKLMGLDAKQFETAYEEMVRNGIEKDKPDMVMYHLTQFTPERLETLWRREAENAKRDPKSFSSFEIDEKLLAHGFGRGSAMKPYRKYVRHHGKYSHRYRYGPNKGLSTIFNHAKLLDGGFPSTNDIVAIVKVVQHYLTEDKSLSPKLLGENIENLVQNRKESIEYETRQFRRELWTSIAIFTLYSVPTFKSISSIIINIPETVRSPWSAKGVVYTLSDTLLISQMTLVSFCQAKLLSEKRTNPDFRMGESFGGTPATWFYTISAAQLAFQATYRMMVEGDACDGKMKERYAMAAFTIFCISKITFAHDPDPLMSQFVTESLTPQLTSVFGSILYALYSLSKIDQKITSTLAALAAVIGIGSMYR
jgi:hypothetical protein